MKKIYLVLALIILIAAGEKPKKIKNITKEQPPKKKSTEVQPPQKAPPEPAPTPAAGQQLLDNLGKDKRPLVLSLIAPYSDLVKQLGQNNIKVATLLEPGEDLHHLQVTKKSALKIEKADIYLAMGMPYEARLIISQLPQTTLVIALDQSVDPLPQLEQQFLHDVYRNDAAAEHADDDQDYHDEDRHYWLSPDQVLRQLPLIKDALVKKSPQHSQQYSRNLQELQQKIEKLSHQITLMLAPLANQNLILYHPFLNYFLQQYSLNGISVKREDREVTIKEIQQLQSIKDDIFIHSLFVVPTEVSPNTRLIADKLDWRLVQVEPFPNSWQDGMLAIAQTIYAEYLYWQSQGR